MRITKRQLRRIIQEQVNLIKEDGHTDVPYVKRKLRASIEDSTQMLSKLDTMREGDHLPTWWIGKIVISTTYLNKCRDYLVISGEDKLPIVDSGVPQDLRSVEEMEYW